MNRTSQEIGDELYGLAPQAFTAARDRYVAEARNAGNRALATELASWKRPSVAAGLVNLVALRRPDSVRSLIELGHTIRDVQGAGPAGNVTPIQLRDLSAQRRKELDAVVALAQSLAAERGDAAPSRAVLSEIESTFASAMADDAAARLVQPGRVLKALSYSGFGQLGEDASAVFAAAPPTGRRGAVDHTRPAADAKATNKRAAEREAERAAAEAAQRRARAEDRVSTARLRLADSTAAEAAAEADVRRLADQITELSHRLDVAQRDARAARQTRLAAERDLTSAERVLHRHG